VTQRAYYNEIDSFAAEWLRNLIREGVTAPGDVDERDIRDVTPTDLAPYNQCHFFAGLGTWSYALRRAGWPDDRPVWTGSCPCQPFSAAGKRGGLDDERHLWPAWFWLIEQSGPCVIFGEQVSSKDGLAWLDLVSSDLEGAGYAIGPLDLCAAGVGAPHIRQRLYFVAHAERDGWRADEPGRRQERRVTDGRLGSAGILADATGGRWNTRIKDHAEAWHELHHEGGSPTSGFWRDAEGDRDCHGTKCTGGPWAYEYSADDNLGHAKREGLARREGQRGNDEQEQSPPQRTGGPTGGFWRNAEWLPCRDGKARPTQPGIAPLAYGLPRDFRPLQSGLERMGHSAAEARRMLRRPRSTMALAGKNRIGRLRGYGNGIVAPLAIEFIKAYMEVENG